MFFNKKSLDQQLNKKQAELKALCLKMQIRCRQEELDRYESLLKWIYEHGGDPLAFFTLSKEK